MTEDAIDPRPRRSLTWWLLQLGSDIGDFWGRLFSNNDDKIDAMSRFVGHMVNYTFIQIAFYFSVDVIGKNFEWEEVWLTIAVCMLFFFNLLYSLRLVTVITEWLQGVFWPSLPVGRTATFLGMIWWCCQWAVWIGFLVALNFFNASVTSALSDIAKPQTPSLTRPIEPKTRTAPANPAPSCHDDLCIA